MADQLLWTATRPTRFSSGVLPLIRGRLRVERHRSRPFSDVVSAWFTPLVFTMGGLCLAAAGYGIGGAAALGALLYAYFLWHRQRRTPFVASVLKCELFAGVDSTLLIYAEQDTRNRIVWGVEVFGVHTTSAYFPQQELDQWLLTYADPLTAVLVTSEVMEFLGFARDGARS